VSQEISVLVIGYHAKVTERKMHLQLSGNSRLQEIQIMWHFLRHDTGATYTPAAL